MNKVFTNIEMIKNYKVAVIMKVLIKDLIGV